MVEKTMSANTIPAVKVKIIKIIFLTTNQFSLDIKSTLLSYYLYPKQKIIH